MKYLASLYLLLGLTAMADDSWPRFRGAEGRGVSAQSVPVKLDASTRAWSVPLAGPGSSSPVVWGDSVFVTGEDRRKGEVVFTCLDARTGKTRWADLVLPGSYHTHKMNNTAAATPGVSKDVVVFSWYNAHRGVAVLSAYSHAGKDLWTYDIGPFKGSHGLNLHPEIHHGRIVIAHLHQNGGAVIALDAKSGKLVWQTDYPAPSKKTTYITPLVRKRNTGGEAKWEVVVAATSIGVCGIDFETGKELWSLPGVFKERCIVSPVDILSGSGSSDSLVTVGCKNNVFFAVRPPNEAGGKAAIAWRMDRNAPYVPTPVSDGKTLYVLSDGGVLTAVEAASGKPLWQENLQANFYASPLLIGGKLYCLTREGEMQVAEVGKTFQHLATSNLKPGDEVTWCDATPAVAHNSLYVRLGARLDCYRMK